ncbi:MAG: sugar nucleotide-binding protein [Bordetella sp.]|uniref:sugar nucleotide-binding protein n=1 Tax=Bordetella sp. TaxID=28081 RepID=UPI003F7B6D69
MNTPFSVPTLGSVLVTGAEGHIARGLLGALAGHGNRLWSTTRRPEHVGPRCLYLDLDDDLVDWSLPSDNVDIVFLCAAVSPMDRCGQEPESTHRVNVTHTVELAKRFIARGAFVVFLSTALVLGGDTPYARVDDPYKPSVAYVMQKAQAERDLLALGDRVAIIRMGKVIVPDMPLFNRWIEALRAGETIHPFNNLVMAPISLDFTVDVLCRVAAARLGGIVHATASRDISYATAADIIARRIGVHDPSVAPIAGKFSPHVAVPRYAALDTTSLEALGLSAPMPEAAFDYLGRELPQVNPMS